MERFTVPPDPGQAATLDDLVELLRLLKVWAGNPSYERITERVSAAWRAAGRPPNELARKTTVVRCFEHGRRRWNTDLVVAVVQALHPDVGYVTQWRQALRVIGGETQAASQVRVQDALPDDLTSFTGRATELEHLRLALQHGQRKGGPVVVTAIAGMAGVGKTQLAVHAAHMLGVEQAYDRVLFVNLRGFHPDPAQPPADPAAVLDGFLRLLGVPGQQIPHDLPARTAAYRDRLAGASTLVVLDNVANSEQVRPLLPQTPGCMTLVTSRRSLTDLPSATHLTLDVFTAEEAAAFLADAVPEVLTGSDPHALTRLAESCGHLPLALGLVAGHIRNTPGWTLTDHADRLDERRRHQRLENGVQLALDLSYKHLPADQQQVLRMTALLPGQDFDAYAAAALSDSDLSTAGTMLQDLCRDHLLQQPAAGRYSFHDLVRVYATIRAGDEDPPPQRHTALTRLFDFYLVTTAAAMDVAYSHEQHRRPTVPPARTLIPDLTDHNGAEDWLDAELANLLAAAQHAAEHGWPEHCWHLSATLHWHLRMRGRYSEAEKLHQHALTLARNLVNHQAEIKALNSLGYIDRRLGRHEPAGDHYKQALRIAQVIGDRVGELNALHGLGCVHYMLCHYQQAEDHFRRALQIAQDIGDRLAELNARSGLGAVHWTLGRHGHAGNQYARALQIAQTIGHRLGKLNALHGLGRVHLLLGRHEEARDHHTRALQIAQDIGDHVGELQALASLGQVHRTLGHHSEAAHWYQQAFELARDDGNRNWQCEALQGLGRLHQATGHPDRALTYHEKALQYATELAQPGDQARAHDGLAHAHYALNDHTQARWHWQRALEILTSLNTDHSEDIEATVPNIRAHLTKLNQQSETASD
jgi:tetratricopeptide (TPR) repeat protein